MKVAFGTSGHLAHFDPLCVWRQEENPWFSSGRNMQSGTKNDHIKEDRLYDKVVSVDLPSLDHAKQ